MGRISKFLKGNKESENKDNGVTIDGPNIKDSKLNINNKELEKELEKMQALLSKTERDVEFWHRQFKQYHFTQCGHCGKKLMIWPYESVAYYIVKDKNGNPIKYVHSACYDDYLGEGHE